MCCVFGACFGADWWVDVPMACNPTADAWLIQLCSDVQVAYCSYYTH